MSPSTVPAPLRPTFSAESKAVFVSSPNAAPLSEKKLDAFRIPSAPGQADSSSFERLKLRLASAFFVLFTLGWGDGVTGTLLPYFKNDFDLSFMTSSLLFVASASGYAIGTFSVELIAGFLGRAHFSASKYPALISLPSFKRQKSPDQEEDISIVGFSISRCRFFTLALASLLHAAYFVIMGSKRGFASMLAAYAISSFARSLMLATLNVYVSSVSKRGLGYMYGSWAIGAFGAPLVCQSIIATGIRWANFYFGSLVLSVINTSLIVYAFRPSRSELHHDADLVWGTLRSIASAIPTTTVATSVTKPSIPSPTDNTAPVLPKKHTVGPRTYMSALKKPKMWASAVFAMIYTGSESSTQGFIVIYLLSMRNANPNTVGYVTSGFWGGMAISRFLWGYLGAIITFRQRKWIVYGCIFLALCMHLLIWFVPSSIENAFSVAVVGLAYGPIYPANLVTARELLPPEVHLVSLAVVAAFGSIGAAIFPFVTGTLSTLVGPQTLPYITVSQCVVLFVLWFLFPSQIAAQL